MNLYWICPQYRTIQKGQSEALINEVTPWPKKIPSLSSSSSSSSWVFFNQLLRSFSWLRTLQKKCKKEVWFEFLFLFFQWLLLINCFFSMHVSWNWFKSGHVFFDFSFRSHCWCVRFLNLFSQIQSSLNTGLRLLSFIYCYRYKES